MKDYIAREAACELLAMALDDDWEPKYAADRMNEIPAADVRPVVRGKWQEWWPGDCTLVMTGEEMLWMCSECTAKFSDQSAFCSHCGADMRGENK